MGAINSTELAQRATYPFFLLRGSSERPLRSSLLPLVLSAHMMATAERQQPLPLDTGVSRPKRKPSTSCFKYAFSPPFLRDSIPCSTCVAESADSILHR